MSLDTPDPRTWVDDDSISASLLNTELRDALRFITTAGQTTVRRSSDISAPNGWSAITWDDQLDDVDNLISVPSTTFTFTRPGVIAARCKITLDGNTAGRHRQIRAIYTPAGGSATDVAAVSDGPSTAYAQVGLAVEIPVNVGDQLRFEVYQDSGAGLNLLGGGCFAVIRWVGNIGEWQDPDAVAPPPEPGGSTPPPTNPVKHTKTYSGTWHRTYDGDGGTTWDDTSHLFQGYYSSARGNTRSLVGLDWRQIKSDLAGATNVSAKLTYRDIHSYYYSGLTVIIGAHKYSTKPGTWANGSVDQDKMRHHTDKGATSTVTLPSSIVNGLKSGTYKGIAFGPGPSTSGTYYGYLSGTSVKVTFTYYK